MPIQQKGHELFVSRLYDMQDACLQKGRSIVTSFLTPAEQTIARTLIKDVDLHFDGGYENAERKQAILSLDDQRQGNLVCLFSAVSPHLEKPRHPDVLGALMHEGISREVIGDILCTKQGIYLFCSQKMAAYIIQNLRMVKKQPVLFAPVHPEEVPDMERQEILVNVSSLRADSVVAALAHCSRSKALEMIRQGNVKINDVVLEDPCKLCNNDHVSIRRCGRFLFVEVAKTTRKERMVLKFQKYT